jgi:hypothetical protein
MDWASSSIRAGESVLWDGRFSIHLASDFSGVHSLRALGPEGSAAVKSAKGHFGDLPFTVIQTLPSLWQAERLCYVPFVQWLSAPPADWLSSSLVTIRFLFDSQSGPL